MRLYLFYFAILLFIVGWIVVFKPYEVKKIPPASQVISLEKFNYKKKDVNGTKVLLEANRGRINNQLLTAFMLDLYFPDKNASLRAKEARMKEKTVDLKGNVEFVSDDFRFYTDRARYLLNDEVLYVPERFRYVSNRLSVWGGSLVYYKSIGKIVANKIRAKVFQ